MRLGVYSDLGTTDAESFARETDAAGCGAVVFPLKYYEDPEKIEEYVIAVKSHGLEIAETGAWSSPISPDPEVRKQAFEKSVGQLALADRIGASCCVSVTGSVGGRWDGPARENLTKETWKKAVRAIQEIIDEVNPKTTYYAVEAMPWMFPTGPDEYLHLMEDVGRDHFSVHLDICNWMNSAERFFHAEEFMDEVFEKLGPYIRSCHLKDVKLLEGYTFQLKEVPCGKGDLPLAHYLQCIEKQDHGMPVIIEHLGSTAEYRDRLYYAQNLCRECGILTALSSVNVVR